MNEFTALTLDEFLDRGADRIPSPGGGCVTAVVGALACSMARMAASYSNDNNAPIGVRKQVADFSIKIERADKVMRRLVQEDAAAYQAMIAAAREARRDEQAGIAHQDAVIAAISIPTQMAATASEVLSAMDEFKNAANKNLLSELGVAAVLADATAKAAKFSVMVNLPELHDLRVSDTAMDQVSQIITRCGQLCASIQAYVQDYLRTVGNDNHRGVRS